MADTKVSDLASHAASAWALDDYFMLIDKSDTTMDATDGTNKKSAIQDLVTYLQANHGLPRKTRLGTQHSISSTTGTEVTDLQQTLEAGTFVFTYTLFVQSATATVGPMLGVNFTGTHTKLGMHFRFADDTTAVTGEVHEMDNQGNLAFGFVSGMAQNAESTTAPNMGTSVGVSTTGSDMLCFIEGLIVVTASGDLELWHSSETATATSVEVGSSLVVIRTA